MAQPDPVTEPESPPPTAAQVDVWQRTSMAAERTWLAWWRTALTATAGALAVGRFAPELLGVAPWPYVLLGCGYAALALALLVFGALRQGELEHSILHGIHAPLPFGTGGGVHDRRGAARGHDRRAHRRTDLAAAPATRGT
jgi:putative membrane protein